mgnify:CR=1 FL=1|tara:strand:+ start:3294 stop:3491 length:198 start_codon:yes stop_codon:yes gene_type:complete
MSSIVEWLRAAYARTTVIDVKRLDEAAARIEQLEAEIKTAIRQFEDGSLLQCHRTLCTVIYGKQH